MKKEEQRNINAIVEKEWEKAYAEYKKECDHSHAPRLRSCSAWVYESTNYYFLRSYNTIIACIDKTTDTCYDVLRMVYGYTSTSAQHIAKFSYDYGKGKRGCEHKMRWYN